ncbi:MAG: L-serine ammonia-lyase, iron-sulfur-dependent, subunit alpha [Bacteroidales bacterium]|jgi:L-cysteine desulfidase|nr:L-serine ammonia-lyase, iron-sulfur-dependent, subunit alpha [Bacteroidales bacterium]MCI2122498.1 L-serine ammonia-lyase, iron-sulfur-dependent, subunit alpha [Bacteroidales bacterium]MCI2145473.1 L-serine ammonia-lyase, iron-sulfur-dependent, subunit alpha [Bacteroidales bacterium]
MLDINIKEQLISLLHSEVKPALGCTEPVAVSLAVAAASERLKEIGIETDRIFVEVSPNIMKNGMGVGIPGTGMVGLKIAAALGSVCGKSAYKLEVLKDVDKEAVSKAKSLLPYVTLRVSDNGILLYIRAICYGTDAEGSEHSARAIIEYNHDSIVLVERDGKVLYATEEAKGGITVGSEKEEHPKTPGLKEIWEFATTADFEEIKFILEAAKMNNALAKEGMNHCYGLQVGRTIASESNSEVYGNGVFRYAMALTAAASDARMAGCPLPAMSNSGSGNQGITVTMPVVAVAEKMEASEEQLARALIIAHLTAIHIKSHLGKLSALCGCVIASTGASCGIVYLRGGSFDQICYAVKNMIGNITGMVCDGAKTGCALKVASGVSSAMQSAILALNGICISCNDGIIDSDTEKCIENLGDIGSKGMVMTDNMILRIMENK